MVAKEGKISYTISIARARRVGEKGGQNEKKECGVMFSVVKKFALVLERKQKKKLMILFFLMLIGAFLEVLGVSLMIPLISAIMKPDIIETNEMVRRVCQIFDLHSHRTFVILCIVALILVFVIKDLFLIGEYYIQYRFIYNNRFVTQKKLLEVFLNRPYEYYLNVQSGEIIRVIQSDVTGTYTLLTTLLGLVTETIVSIALVTTIFFVNPMMTVFVAVMMGGIILIIAKVVKPGLRKAGVARRKNEALMNKWLLQAITGVKEIKVTQKERFFENHYDSGGRQYMCAERKNSVLGQTPRLLIEMVSICSMLVWIALMIYSGREIENLITSLSAFAMAAVKLMPSANRIVAALNAVAYQEPALDKMLANLETMKKEKPFGGQKEEKTQNEECDTISLKREICLRQVTYSYPNSSQKVLQGADMTIPVGKSVGIVGTSGAGKTTAVDIMLGLLAPQEGQILADGVDVQKNYSAWLSHIGYIPQSIFMLDDSIRANVAFGLDEDEIDDKQVWHALEEAQMAEFIKTLPDGIHTQIGERGVRVSGGQRQRIGIARALYPNPELLLFDEATSALDNETEAAIMESINSLHGKKTMVIIAHRLQTIEGCDMVYRVKDGKIIRER